jgi:hypothetical protein
MISCSYRGSSKHIHDWGLSVKPSELWTKDGSCQLFYAKGKMGIAGLLAMTSEWQEPKDPQRDTRRVLIDFSAGAKSHARAATFPPSIKHLLLRGTADEHVLLICQLTFGLRMPQERSEFVSETDSIYGRRNSRLAIGISHLRHCRRPMHQSEDSQTCSEVPLRLYWVMEHSTRYCL